MKTLAGTLFLLMGAGFFAMPHALPIDYIVGAVMAAAGIVFIVDRIINGPN